MLLKHSNEVAPSIFAIIQTRGGECHRRILHSQKRAAASCSNKKYGKKVKQLHVQESKSELLQKQPCHEVSGVENEFSGFVLEKVKMGLDEKALPLSMCIVAKLNLDLFRDALLFSVPLAKTTSSTNSPIIKDDEMRTTASAKSHGKTSSSTLFDSPPSAKKKAPPVSNADIELKIAPVKKAARIAAKVREYRQENEEDGFPFCQRVLDILRASFIVNTAKEMHMAFEGIRSSGAFKLIRLKNKICDGSPPFNLHLNALFWPKCCRVPMVIEIQFYFRSVYGLQQRQHLAYELRRAISVQEVS